MTARASRCAASASTSLARFTVYIRSLAATTVLAAPSAGARDVGQYDAGIEVAIIGTAERADYYYVSPCNACESGFVPKSAVDVRPEELA